MRRRDFIVGLGGAAAWPLMARAQQRAKPVIGILSGASARASDPLMGSFYRGLSGESYEEGRNVEILHRWAETQFDRLPELAADLVRHRVAVIVAMPPIGSALAAKTATSTIPIVFVTGFDPVQLGLITSLNCPAGNITGVTFLTGTLIAKRLELLREIVPAVTRIGLLVNPTTPTLATQINEAEIAAKSLGVQLLIRNASTPSDIDLAFAKLVEQRIGALLAGTDTLFAVEYARLTGLAARFTIPAIYSARVAVEAGGLMSYGADFFESWRVAGTYVGRILKGERPGDLPVQRSTRIEMVLNLRTAKALGIEVPTATLLRATEVIE